MSENETAKIEDVTVNDLTQVEFPKVNENAVNALNGVSETPKTETQKTENDELQGYNPEIHETPPRKNRFGEWAKKRGNKKGFGFPKTENEKPKMENEKPPLEIPQNPQEAAAEMEAAQNVEVSTEAAAALFSQCFYTGLNVWADYTPSEMEKAAHRQATYKYLMTRGGCELPTWAELAAISAQSIYAASQKEKAQSKIQKFKTWIVSKIYAWKNRNRKQANENKA